MAHSSKPLPAVEVLSRFFVLDRVTGALFWKARPDGEFQSAVRAKKWRELFVGTRADRLDRQGYRRVQIYIDGKRQIFQAHRVVFKMVHGRDPVSLVDHINRDKSNNSPSNLREATHEVNCRNRSETVQLTANQIRTIRQLGQSSSKKLLAEQFGISRRRLDWIIEGRTWRSLP